MAQTALTEAAWSSSGASATVHRVAWSGTHAAVKVAPLEALSALAHEARILATVASRNLPELWDIGWWDIHEHVFVSAPPRTLSPDAILPRSLESANGADRLPCIVTSFLPHGELPRGPDAALRAAADIAAGLADLHATGFSHGDVKLANVVFSEARATLVDVGFAGDASTHELRAGTTRYLALGDPSLGSATARDLLALGIVVAEIAEPAIRVEDDPIRVLRRTPLPGVVGALVDALVAVAPAARPHARDVVAAATGRTHTTALASTVRGAYMRARGGALEGTVDEGLAPWLDDVAAWHAKIARFEGRAPDARTLRALTEDELARWLVALAGPRAAAWPVGILARAGEATLARALERLAQERAPATWSFDDVERARSARSTPSPRSEAPDWVETVARVTSTPPDPDALDTILHRSDAPAAATFHAARALRLQGDVASALELARRLGGDVPGAPALIADLLRRRGDWEGVLRAHADTPPNDELDAIAARVHLDRGDAPAALALVVGKSSARTAEVEILARGATRDLGAARDAFDRGLVRARSDEERARLFGALGFALAAHDPPAARRASREAAALAARACAYVEEATYLTSVAALAVDEGYFAEALSASERASLLWDGLGRPEMAARAYLARAAPMRSLAIAAPRARCDSVSRPMHDRSRPRAACYRRARDGRRARRDGARRGSALGVGRAGVRQLWGWRSPPPRGRETPRRGRARATRGVARGRRGSG
ncbi:MAG: hypothetical protein U0414_15680 [Polyangiaceae bacterium]